MHYVHRSTPHKCATVIKVPAIWFRLCLRALGVDGGAASRPGADPQFDCGVTTTLKNAQQIQAETPPTEKVTWKGNLQELRVLHLLMHATHAGEDEIGIDEHVVLATMGSWQVYDSGYAHPSTFSVHRVEFACYQSAPLFLVPRPSFLWCSR